MTRGRFVVVEGGDGSGKTTQAGLLTATLRRRGLTVCETFEPGATPTGKVLREVLLHGRDPIVPVAEALLMAADRAENVADLVRPALSRGEWVVSDRHLPSSLVYQGIVRGLGVDVVRAINEAAVAGVVPDLVVVVDLPSADAATRRDADPDRMEAEDRAFHAAVAAGYRALAVTEGWTVVDGGGAREEVAARVLAVVEPLLAGSGR